MKSSIIFILPKTALPTLHVSPIVLSTLFFIREILCRVFSIPALLSSPTLPNFSRTKLISSSETISFSKVFLRSE